jgi:oxygen-independent coproporphyrinogen-3 oxidase
VEDFADTVEKIIDLAPDRIAVFNYAHVPWMKKHMALIKEEDIPAPEVKLDILKMTVEKLTSAGYVFIGMDHFSKPEDDLAKAFKEKRLYRNFQGYSTNAGADLYGMGITSIGQIGKAFAQNHKTEKEYYQALDEGLLPIVKGSYMNEDDIIRREVIMKIMCDFELKYETIEKKFNIDFEKYFAWGLSRFDQMINDGLLTIENRKITVNEVGRLLIRNIAMNFDGYIERKEDIGRYSRTV